MAPNIALIKYWGKLDEELIIPLNGSLSVTLDLNDIFTLTKVTFIACLSKQADKFTLNKLPQTISSRTQKILDLFRAEEGYFEVESENNFPTASGLASSASGFAALVLCLQDIFPSQQDVSELARLGSGSATRSIYGGIVEWLSPSIQQIDLQNFKIIAN